MIPSLPRRFCLNPFVVNWLVCMLVLLLSCSENKDNPLCIPEFNDSLSRDGRRLTLDPQPLCVSVQGERACPETGSLL